MKKLITILTIYFFATLPAGCGHGLSGTYINEESGQILDVKNSADFSLRYPNDDPYVKQKGTFKIPVYLVIIYFAGVLIWSIAAFSGKDVWLFLVMAFIWPIILLGTLLLLFIGLIYHLITEEKMPDLNPIQAYYSLKCVWNSKNPKKARKAFERVTKPKLILKIARKARLEEIRKMAIEKLDNSVGLARVVQDTVWRETGVLAKNRWTAKYVYLDLSKNTPDKMILEAAVEKIKEKKLVELLNCMKSPEVIAACIIRKINDMALIEEIARQYNHNASIKKMAEERLDSFGLLTAEQRKTMIQTAEDKSLVDLAGYSNDWGVRLDAYKKMDGYNEEIYNAILNLERWHGKSRKEAATKLIPLLLKDRFVAGLFWNDCARLSCKQHDDYVWHDDCGVDRQVEPATHEDTGIGVVFPPYPYND